MGMGYTQILDRGISFVTAVPRHAVGERCHFNGNDYVYICNRSSDKTALIGYAMTLSSHTSYSAVISGTTDVDSPIGVVKHVDIPVAEYGWIVTKGLCPAIAGSNTGLAVGDACIMVGTTNTGNISRKTSNTLYSQFVGGRPRVFAECVQLAATAAEGTINIY